MAESNVSVKTENKTDSKPEAKLQAQAVYHQLDALGLIPDLHGLRGGAVVVLSGIITRVDHMKDGKRAVVDVTYAGGKMTQFVNLDHPLACVPVGYRVAIQADVDHQVHHDKNGMPRERFVLPFGGERKLLDAVS